MERLDKLLSSRTAFSRKEIKEAVKTGKISVNEKCIKDASVKVSENDRIYLNGEELFLPKHIYLMMNKPAGLVSATRDSKEKTVMDLIPKEYLRPGLFPAGRLDKDTEGFLLITDDGEFAHRILSPQKHISKSYELIAEHPILDDDILKLENEMELEDGTKLQKAKVNLLDDNDRTHIEIIICEGKYHQIKRMLAAINNSLISLKRTKMGNLPLDSDLKSGRCRILTPEEIQNIEGEKSISDFDQ